MLHGTLHTKLQCSVARPVPDLLPAPLTASVRPCKSQTSGFQKWKKEPCGVGCSKLASASKSRVAGSSILDSQVLPKCGLRV